MPLTCLRSAASAALAAGGLLALFGPRPASAATVVSTWKPNVTNVWSATTNWANVPLLGGFPNNGNAGVAAYDAVINTGTVTLDSNITIQKFTLGTGTLNGGFNLTTNELFTWSGGTLTGAGVNPTSAVRESKRPWR